MTDVWSYFLEFKGEQFELDGDDLTVGRSRTCDVSIKDPSVSRRHVCLATAGGKVRLTDLGSSNGTFINGERIEGEGELGDGDTLGLGDADVQVRIRSRAGFETIRMPQMPSAAGAIPQVGEATSILQKESMRLAKETLGNDLEDSQGPAPATPPAAGSHLIPPAPSAPEPAPPATFAGPPRPLPADEPPTAAVEPLAPSFEPPPAPEETSFAGLDDGSTDFDAPGEADMPSFALPDEEPDLVAPSPLENPRATIELPTIPSTETEAAVGFEEPAAPQGLEAAPPELPRLELADPPPAPVPPTPEASPPTFQPPSPAAAAPELPAVAPEPPAVAPEPPAATPEPPLAAPEPPAVVPEPLVKPLPTGPASMATSDNVGDRTDVRQPAPPADSEEERSGEMLPSLDGFDTTLGPGTPIPESMLRAQESMAKVREESQSEEPLPKPYEQPIQVPPMAGFGPRLLATLLDDVWVLALSAGAWISLQEVGAAVAGGVSFLVILTGWAIWGTTPGKRLLGLYICTEDGQAGLGMARSLLRLVGYLVSILSLGVGFLMILSSSRRGLHDRIAGTYVRRFK